MEQHAARAAIVEACRRMNQLGINQGTSGNVSTRWREGMLISPSAVPYDELAPEQIAYVETGGVARGPTPPSSEWRLHLNILRLRSDLNAVVHAHPPYSTALAICGRDIPPIHYMVAAAGGSSVRCATYHTFGTAELSESVVDALDGRRACLIANHGMVACGARLDEALSLAVEVEALARQYVLALQIGDPVLLSEAEIDRVLEKFESHGYR